MNKPTIMIVDENQALCDHLKKDLLSQGFEIQLVHDQTSACKLWQLIKPALIIICSAADSRWSGLDFISIIRSSDEITPLILVARQSTEAFAIKALKLGVNDYFKGSLDYYELLDSIKSNLAKIRETFVNTQSSSNADSLSDQTIIGDCPAIKKLKVYLKKVAAMDSTVLITGQTGTGKECVARQIHQYSPRHDKPMICINCAALPDNLLESELFGFERGAFTGANSSYQGKLKLAEGGTVFFDEIGDMSPYAQAKVLRIFENKEITPLRSKKNTKVDIRIIAATNHDLKQLVAQHQFREDLYYRVNVINIDLPPLKERKEDIPLLTAYYLQVLAAKFHKNISSLNDEALQSLLGYDWPGNIRELKNIIEAVVMNQTLPTITRQDLPDIIRQCTDPLVGNLNEKELLISTLWSTDWNKSKTAEKLHWSRMTVYRKMAKYDIVPERRTNDTSIGTN
ncbi:MAG: sigma-54-dependent Fis family transcriptional regulator [Gammaproteobacteria bacterium]|nr:sigma-54-dependent Fis family transcriptional regulator [Gammaproteobacteria bacterium]